MERMPSLASISRLEEAAAKRAKGVTMFLGRLLRGTDPLDGPDSSEYRRWTGARKTAELRLSLLLLLAFQLRSLSSRSRAAAPATATSVRPYVRPSALARPPDRRLLPSTLVTRARAEQKHLREFFSQMCRSIHELDGIGTALSPPQFQGTKRVCSALEQLL